MATSQYSVERATNGLVTALFLAAALFIVVLGVQLIRDFDARVAGQATGAQSSASSGMPHEP